MDYNTIGQIGALVFGAVIIFIFGYKTGRRADVEDIDEAAHLATKEIMDFVDKHFGKPKIETAEKDSSDLKSRIANLERQIQHPYGDVAKLKVQADHTSETLLEFMKSLGYEHYIQPEKLVVKKIEKSKERGQ
jgi:hypothetical protein